MQVGATCTVLPFTFVKGFLWIFFEGNTAREPPAVLILYIYIRKQTANYTKRKKEKKSSSRGIIYTTLIML
jgi:hypothetical protein